IVRKVVGNAIEERKLPPGPPLAGKPIVSGKWLILPLANGSLSRLSIENLGAPVETGPSWRASRLPASTPCYLTPINADELFATDGTRAIVRWRWATDSKAFESMGLLKLPE